ncbi:MAG TPA: DNA primase [Cryomorphaceae bacterium]|nr:DNA primase [Cryomorphaceae bacterium]
MGRITASCVEKILDSVRIEEVVGDFVQLKKSGSSFRGLSPFSQEKTPSFYVVPSKQIFKDFSSGKGGSAVTFLMEHEQLTYPDALRWLAKKYNIEIEEEASSEEADEARNIRESLLAVNAFAAKQFSTWMWEDAVGRSVGLSYLRERGFTEETIRRFELGFHLEGRSSFFDAARAAGYQAEYLVGTGLSIARDDGSHVDRFWGRAMFPIHSLGGRIVGFGGRVLKSDAKTAKYLNSPESDIYHKSRVVYGLYQAKQSIARQDRCYIVEGYTDVISLSQAGVQNVVSSSGTALTVEQIRLVKRLTSNVTLLYDGDSAGIRASFRGMDLLLEEGMLVRAVPLPEGEDPDSLARSMDTEGLQAYLSEHEVDFMQFKSDLLIESAGKDPIKRAELVKDIIHSIAKIPNAILREVYLRDSAQRLGMDERSLFAELDRIRAADGRAAQREQERQQPDGPTLVVASAPVLDQRPPAVEEALMRILLLHANDRITGKTEDGEEFVDAAGPVVLDDLATDELTFSYPVYAQIHADMDAAWKSEERILTSEVFSRHAEPAVASVVAELLTERYALADWKRKNIFVQEREDHLSKHVEECLFRFKELRLSDMIIQLKTELESTEDADKRGQLLAQFTHFQGVRNALHKKLNRVL